MGPVSAASSRVRSFSSFGLLKPVECAIIESSETNLDDDLALNVIPLCDNSEAAACCDASQVSDLAVLRGGSLD